MWELAGPRIMYGCVQSLYWSSLIVFQSSSHQWAVACRSSCPWGDAGILMGWAAFFIQRLVTLIFFSLLVTFLSFDVKEWVVENDLLVQRLKVSIKVTVY